MTVILTRSDVETIVRETNGGVLDDLVERIAQGYRELAAGDVQQHSRIYLREADDPARRPPGLFSMSALLPRAGLMGSRLVAINRQGGGGDAMLVLFDHTTSSCLAIIDDSVLHRYRTGAPAALATRLLARPGSAVVGCVGSGAMAAGGLIMIARELPALRTVRVYSPTPAHRREFAADLTARLGVRVDAVGSADEAAAGADVILTATDADRPLISDDAISAGTHLNLLARNEIEMQTFARARLVMASAQALRELDPPWSDPLPDEWCDRELADVVNGRAPGRDSDDEVTVFVGGVALAMWDVEAATAFFQQGQAMGLGTVVELRE